MGLTVIDTRILTIDDVTCVRELKEKGGELNEQAFDDLTEF